MRIIITLLVILALPIPASYASRAGRRNTALVLGGATVYSLARGKGTQALILGAGTYYAYRRYKDSKGHSKLRRECYKRVTMRDGSVYYVRVRCRHRGHHYGWRHR